VDVAAWLKHLGLERYRDAFRDAEITSDVLCDLGEADLEKLGLPLGPRKKLMRAIGELKNTPSGAPASPSRPPTGTERLSEAERRQLTVMFIDLVGSTALSAQLDPEDMREVIRAYQNAVAGEITRLQGHVAKFMGDGVLAYFGWPRSHEDEAERAIRAGLAVAHAIPRLQTPVGKPLQTRIGIATGLVVVGDLIGAGASREEAVVGDTPNLAARLQAAAEPGAVVIAEATRRLVGDLFVVRDLGAQRFKGLDEPTPVYLVTGVRPIESRFAARHAGGVAAIVGRNQELGLLVERWRQARTGEGQAVLLTGEAGIGKSRISEALVEAAAAEPHFLVRYQCSPYHTESALYPVIQQMSFAAGFTGDDTTDRHLDRLEALVARATDDVRTAAPLMASLLNIDGGLRYGELGLTPQQRRNRTFAVLMDQMTGLANRKPVLWVVEDAHWIDPTTLELIELALDRVQGSRVLLLITARPTLVAAFASHPVVTRLALNRLAKAATQAIIARITAGKRLPEALLERIAARTDGVPLFVEEMTKAVLESGVLREGPEAYHLDGSLSTLAIPTTLHDSLMARLDRLQPVKEVAQTAAVIGRSFDHGTIAALAALPEVELNEAMRRLVEAELVFRRGSPPDATYLFKHALVRDAAYESLLKTKRIALHARLLDVLEKAGSAAPEIKAQHAEAAGLTERALDYWEQAGVQALARPAYKEAIASLENAMRLCRTQGDEPRWKRREQGLQVQVGQALIANRGYQAPETVLAFERALTLADEIGDPSLQVPALSGQCSSIYVSGSAEFGDLAQRLAALVETQPERWPRVVGLRMLVLERLHKGRFKESLALTRKSLEAYDPVAHRDLAHRFGHDPRTAAATYQVWNLWHLGFPDQATRPIEDNLVWARRVNHANTTGFAICLGVSVPNIWLRRPDQVARSAREALRFAEDNAMALWHAWALIHLGWALSQQGMTGLEEMEVGLREAREIGAGRHEPFHLGLAAEAYARAGRHDEARISIDKAFAALAFGRDMAYVAELHRRRALIALLAGTGSNGATEVDLRRALEISREQEVPSLQLRAARDLAQVLADRGERREAAELLAPIYGWFTEGFDTPDLKEAKALLEQLR
jgi:class 3 adenylate cyclase/tetratricopeptide (TPR) repeat protein